MPLQRIGVSMSHPLILCDYLCPDAIVIESKALTKELFLNEMIQRLCQVSDLKDIEAVQKAVWDREKEGRTVLENGLAIPHARFEGIQDLKACLGILPEGYEDAQEHTLIRWVFLFLSPQNQFRSHLQMLARISRVFQDKDFLQSLLKSDNSTLAFKLLKAKEDSLD